jgi:hypothetical protein
MTPSGAAAVGKVFAKFGISWRSQLPHVLLAAPAGFPQRR